MQDLIDFLQTNSALVLANPIAFSTFAVLFGGGGFIVGRYFLTERIANLESRIARRDDEIAELKALQIAKKLKLPMVPIARTIAIEGSDRSARVSVS
ncbi:MULTISPECIES: hypothetical protein [Mesorhizobium]|uniref:hypothetical protein n=1 Tax=Mesorhizobium TaxID=68287 RepID=UPI00117E540A|nr:MULTISPECIES: hypothetical protein [Mesorhizobium]